MEEAINPYEELMIRVLEASATAAEEKQLEHWLAESSLHQTEFDAFRKIWEGAADTNLIGELDIEADLKAVKQKAKAGQHRATAKVVKGNFYRRIAAILLPLAVVATALFLYFNQQNSNEPILLSDGTKVWLYQDAQLEYPEQFVGNTRTVKLTGEAFFEVAKDTIQPFLIDAGATEIRVLGTSFNVQSQNKFTSVIVNTGKVRLSAKDAPEQAVELTKGEKGMYRNAILSEKLNTNKNYRAWQTGIFEFDGTTPIEEVIAQLSKYYGPIKININANQECALNATFEQEELSTILKTINESCGY